MTELALLLECSTWKNITGTTGQGGVYSSEVSKQLIVQVPFKKE